MKLLSHGTFRNLGGKAIRFSFTTLLVCWFGYAGSVHAGFLSVKPVELGLVSEKSEHSALIERFDESAVEVNEAREWLQSQNEKAKLRSRSEVVREVKRRYNAEVLKIQLNSSKTAYRVRILMPNGRVREVSVNARK